MAVSNVYTGGRAKDMAWLSALVYSDWPVVRRELRRFGFELRKVWDNGDTQGMLVYALGYEWAAIVFRGTEASRVIREDILANFGEPKAWPGRGKAHSGYAKALLKIAWPALQMAEQVSPDTPLYVAGHSMGGSLATLFAAWYARIFPAYKLAGLVTYGAPKALDQTAADSIKARVYRYVMPGDVAPRWPLSRSLVHPGKRVVRLRAKNWWPGPFARHSAVGYAEADY